MNHREIQQGYNGLEKGSYSKRVSVMVWRNYQTEADNPLHSAREYSHSLKTLAKSSQIWNLLLTAVLTTTLAIYVASTCVVVVVTATFGAAGAI